LNNSIKTSLTVGSVNVFPGKNGNPSIVAASFNYP